MCQKLREIGQEAYNSSAPELKRLLMWLVMTQGAIDHYRRLYPESWCADDFLQTVKLVIEVSKCCPDVDVKSMKFGVTDHLLMSLGTDSRERVIKSAYWLFDYCMNDSWVPTADFDQAVTFAELLPASYYSCKKVFGGIY